MVDLDKDGVLTVVGRVKRFAKIGGETRTLLDKVAALTVALESAGTTTPEVDAALAALQDQVGVVDALVPDAAPEQPVA